MNTFENVSGPQADTTASDAAWAMSGSHVRSLADIEAWAASVGIPSEPPF